MATEVGSIVGKLKLDASDWMAQIEEAKAAAHSLGHEDPTIHVETSGVAKAASELEGLKLLSDKVGSGGGPSLKGDASAELDAVANEATRASAATSKLGESSGAAAGEGGGGMTALLGVAIALAPALIPVGAAAVGITGALAGMGAAAGLAIAGISREVAAGKGPLLEYKSVIGTLQGDLHKLEDAAGTGLFSGVQKAVGVLQSNMGAITSIVGKSAKDLGGLLPTALSGILTMVEKLQPAFAAGSKVIGDLVKGFAGFAKSSAFTDFVSYIVKSMPLVESTIKNIMGLAGSLLSALAPIGSALLKSLNPVIKSLADQMPALGKALSSLIPLLPGLASVIVAALPVVGKLLTELGSWVQILQPILIPVLKILADILQAVGTVLTPLVNGVAGAAKMFGELESGTKLAAVGLDIMHGKFGTAAETLGKFTLSMASSIKGVIEFGISIATAVGKAVSAVSTGIARIIAFFASLGGKVLGAIGNFGSLLYNAGANLIEGLINGAESMVGSLISSVENIAGGAVNAAKSLLGIHSPSRVFHEIGQFLVQGFVNGITSLQGLAHGAISGLVPSGMAGLNVGLAGVSGAGSSIGVSMPVATPQAAMNRMSIAPQVHIYNPVAVDPVAQVTQAVQNQLAYFALA